MFNIGGTERYALEPYKNKKVVVSNDKNKIIYRKNKNKKYIKKDAIDFIKVGESRNADRVRLKFVESGKFICVKNRRKGKVTLCNPSEKPKALTWEMEKGKDFIKLKIHGKCLRNEKWIFKKLTMQLKKCKNNKGQKWKIIPQNIASKKAPPKKKKAPQKKKKAPPKKKKAAKKKKNTPPKEKKPTKKADEEPPSEAKDLDDPQVVPNSIIEDIEPPEAKPPGPLELEQIQRDKLDHIAPEFLHESEESGSKDSHLVKMPPVADKPKNAPSDDSTVQVLDQKLNFEYRPPNENNPNGELVQVPPKMSNMQAPMPSQPIPKPLVEPRPPKEMEKAVAQENIVPLGMNQPPQIDRKVGLHDLISKFLGNIEKKKFKQEFMPFSRKPFRKDSSWNKLKMPFDIPECRDLQKPSTEISPDLANPNNMQSIYAPTESNKTWLDDLIETITEKKKRVENLQNSS